MTELPIHSIDELERFLVKLLLPAEASAQFEQGNISKKVLQATAEELKKISEHYVSERGQKGLSYSVNSRFSAEAYSLYYLPINFSKLNWLFKETGLNKIERPLRVLDVGSGPGTASLAALANLTSIHSLTLLESSTAMREVSKRLLDGLFKLAPPKNYFPSVKIVENIEHCQDQKFDLILAANVLNELDRDTRRSHLTSLVSKLDSRGALLVVEPALKHITQALMEDRDWLLDQYAHLNPLFPCTHRASCPMLRASTNDWCHGTMHWTLPRIVAQLDECTGFNKHRIKFSALVLADQGETPSGLRVLREPEKSRHDFKALLCGEGCYGYVSLPKRNLNEVNRPFTRLKELERVRIEGLNEILVIGPESNVSSILD